MAGVACSTAAATKPTRGRSHLLLSCAMPELRRRPAAASEPVPDEPDAAMQPAEKPKKWHEFMSVRVILVLLSLFMLMHIYLWKWVYDIAMDQNHQRFQNTVQEAVTSLYTLFDHL